MFHNGSAQRGYRRSQVVDFSLLPCNKCKRVIGSPLCGEGRPRDGDEEANDYEAEQGQSFQNISSTAARPSLMA
jgi:hypothetical protein